MTLDPRTKPPCNRADALAVLKRLRSAGHVAYFAGGCVRDMVMGIEPKDYDIATDAPPNRVQQLFARTQAVGAAFGVILVRHGRSVIEVATFRSDGRYRDGRHPESVQFATPQEDALRRDFTINGLFFDPIENRVIDYVGGQEDLKARRLRAIGEPDRRFEEDHLRMLRAVRFAARFELTIDPETASAIRRHAQHLIRISPERIADELRLMLTPPTRQSAWVLLWDLKLIGQVMRLLPRGEPGELQPDRSIFLALAPSEPIPFGLALASACLCYRLHAVGQPNDVRPLLESRHVQQLVRAMRQALRISNDESEELADVLHEIRPLLEDAEPTLARKKRFLAKATSPLSRRLLDAIAATGRHVQRIAALRQDFSALEHEDNAPAPLITGDDLTAAGLAPGPAFKRILETIYDAQLEGRISDKSAALAFALRLSQGK